MAAELLTDGCQGEQVQRSGRGARWAPLRAEKRPLKEAETPAKAKGLFPGKRS